MPRINTLESRSNKVFDLLETDIYRMEIKKADVQPNQFAEPDENGVYPDRLVLVWEVFEASSEQDEGVVGMSVWQGMPPWYGTSKRGPSGLKLLVDSLVEQGLFVFDPEDFDTDALIGIKQRVSIEKYIKQYGPNKGDDGNRVVGAPMSLVRKPKQVATRPAAQPKKNVPQEIEEGEEVPF